MKKNILILFLLALIQLTALAQLDTVHWIPPLHSRDNSQVADHYVYLSTPETTPFTVTIKDGSGNTIATPTISNSSPAAYQVGNSQAPASPLFVPIDSLNKVLKRSGLVISAPYPFYANPRVRSGSQADCLTAKGKAALGTTFRVGGFPQVLDANSRNFVVGIMATEPNTTVTISDYNPAILFAGNPTVSATSLTFSLNQGECYVVSGYTNTPANLSGIIGALVQSDKPIVMNNGNLLGTIANDGSQDIGMDQSVPIEKIGQNYILIEGGGAADMERPIVIAHYNNTGIYINGNSSPVATINAGQYYLVSNSYYQGTGHQNMHIHTSEPAYMYQAMAGSTSYATGALNFIPPYNCYMQDSIDLIPMVDKIGNTTFTGGVLVFTKLGATLRINGVVQTGAVPVLSAPWQTYKILGLTGNIKIKSTAGVAAGIFGASGAAGYAGYFSGFSDIPEPSTYSYATTTDTCHSVPINFVSHYDGAIDSLLWNFGDPASGTSDTSTTPNPEHTFSSAGEYIVKLVVYRCENDTVIDTIRAFAIPVAGYSFSDVCYKDTVRFTNTSVTDSATNPVFTWDFGDGSPVSNAVNPIHYYSTPGAYTVRLVAKGGCSDTTTQVVNVFDPPLSSFTFSNVCRADSAVFANTSSPPTIGTIGSWKWSFGDGTPENTAVWSPNHVYSNAGDYTITLTTYSSNLGCADTVKDTITVFPMPTANFSSADICLGDTVHFQDLSSVSTGTITSRDWSLGDSATYTVQHPNHIYTSAGVYTVTLIVTTNNGCKDTVSKDVVVHALPAAQFSISPICHGSSALFTESSSIPITDTIQSWLWDFDDASPPYNQQLVSGGHLYAAAGTYDVQLIVISTFGCSDTINHPAVVNPNPVANFGVNKVCKGTVTLFSDSSSTASGSINSWSWNFGDNTVPGFLPNVPHLYATAGNYMAKLTVTNNFGCTDTLSKPVVVYFNPVTNFSFEDVCLNDSVFFIDSSYVNISASITTYLWAFNDGSPTSGLKNPAHLFASEGTYNVTLISTTNQGCNNAQNKAVHVYDPPVSNFTVTDVCLADSAVFVNTSANPSIGFIDSWQWSFGDGNTTTTANSPYHLYTATGTYPVSLITRSSNLACADTLTDSIAVFPMPIADFSAADVCLEQAISFSDSSVVTDNNTINTWSWNFGDSTAINTLQNPQYTYAAFGQYTIDLIVSTNNGCKDTVNKTLVVHPLPTAAFTAGNVCWGDSTAFTNQSSIPVNITNDLITSWNWDFADNTTVITTPNTSHLYSSMGTYTVELKIISDFGCADSVNKTIVVNPKPQVLFSADDTIGCEPLCVNLTDASIVSPGTNVAWSWNLGDSTTINNSTSVYHCYTNDSVFALRQFTVTLTVTSDSGCVSSLTKNNYITVYPEPVALFSLSPPSTTITNPVISITNLSSGANFWTWNFGGSAIDTSSLENPPDPTYADTGAYVIRLITTTQYNCKDTSYQTLIVDPDFMFYIPNAFTPNDDGVNDTFIPEGMFFYEFEMLIFDRWGNLVYKTEDINKPWNGAIKNEGLPAQQDVYVYYIKATDFRLEKHSYKGIVTLLK